MTFGAHVKENNDTVAQEIEKAVQPNDDAQIFGDYVASELRQLRNQANGRTLKRLINEAIMRVSDLDDSEFQPQSFHIPSPSTSHYSSGVVSPVYDYNQL
jgi:hypothetical protein